MAKSLVLNNTSRYCTIIDNSGMRHFGILCLNDAHELKCDVDFGTDYMTLKKTPLALTPCHIKIRENFS